MDETAIAATAIRKETLPHLGGPHSVLQEVVPLLHNRASFKKSNSAYHSWMLNNPRLAAIHVIIITWNTRVLAHL